MLPRRLRNTLRAVGVWLDNGGRRIDNANDYNLQVAVGQAMASSSLPKWDIFLLQKTGNKKPMGHNDTVLQMEVILQEMNIR